MGARVPPGGVSPRRSELGRPRGLPTGSLAANPERMPPGPPPERHPTAAPGAVDAAARGRAHRRRAVPRRGHECPAPPGAHRAGADGQSRGHSGATGPGPGTAGAHPYRDECPRAALTADVARAVERSAAHVASVVRKETGRTVGQWILEYRMAEARRRLRGTDEQVDIIAERVGYADATHFIRLFRRAHGLTPAAWRRHATGGNRSPHWPG